MTDTSAESDTFVLYSRYIYSLANHNKKHPNPMKSDQTSLSLSSLLKSTYAGLFAGPSFLLLLFLILVPGELLSQTTPYSPGAPRLLVDGGVNYHMNPVWSPDGGRIAFTSAQYRGIWTVDVDNGDPVLLTRDEAAGFGFQWSSDGSAIAARASRYEGHFRLHAVTIYDVPEGTARQLTDFTRQRIGLPQWTDMDRMVAVPDGSEIELLESGLETATRGKRVSDEQVVFARNDRIHAVTLPETRPVTLQQSAERPVLNARLSPDGSRIVFEVVGEGLYVMHSDGSEKRHLGYAEAPVWMPDSRWVAAMVTRDDGHHVTGSEILAIDTESEDRVSLTGHLQDTSLIPLYPTISPDGDRLAFGDYETGRIYVMPIR